MHKWGVLSLPGVQDSLCRGVFVVFRGRVVSFLPPPPNLFPLPNLDKSCITSPCCVFLNQWAFSTLLKHWGFPESPWLSRVSVFFSFSEEFGVAVELSFFAFSFEILRKKKSNEIQTKKKSVAFVFFFFSFVFCFLFLFS